jgi:hypothetical protein
MCCGGNGQDVSVALGDERIYWRMADPKARRPAPCDRVTPKRLCPDRRRRSTKLSYSGPDAVSARLGDQQFGEGFASAAGEVRSERVPLV